MHLWVVYADIIGLEQKLALEDKKVTQLVVGEPLSSKLWVSNYPRRDSKAKWLKCLPKDHKIVCSIPIQDQNLVA